MPGSGQTGGRKGPERVDVIYFPKRTPSRKRTHTETPADPHASRTIEFRPFPEDDDVQTEPLATLPREEPAPRARARGGSPSPAKKTPPEATPRRTRTEDRRITLEIDTDPALRYHVQKLEELLASPSPAEPLRSMDRMELAQMALFGHQLFESGKLEEARVVFEGLVSLDVEDAFPHTMLGTIYLAMGHTDRAAALFAAALNIDPSDLAARVYRAEIQLSGGKSKQPVAELTRVVSEGPEDDPFVQRARRLLQIASGNKKRRK